MQHDPKGYCPKRIGRPGPLLYIHCAEWHTLPGGNGLLISLNMLDSRPSVQSLVSVSNTPYSSATLKACRQNTSAYTRIWHVPSAIMEYTAVATASYKVSSAQMQNVMLGLYLWVEDIHIGALAHFGLRAS